MPKQEQRDIELERNWFRLLNHIEKRIGKKPEDLHGVLFLIGVQELGQARKHFTKEEKQDLMHIAICRLLSSSGYYELEGLDQDGWPHWKLVSNPPNFDLLEQEKVLKMHAIDYFEEEFDINIKIPQ